MRHTKHIFLALFSVVFVILLSCSPRAGAPQQEVADASYTPENNSSLANAAARRAGLAKPKLTLQQRDSILALRDMIIEHRDSLISSGVNADSLLSGIINVFSDSPSLKGGNADSTSIDETANDGTPSDSLAQEDVPILTVDSVLRSVSEDSIRRLFDSSSYIDVQPVPNKDTVRTDTIVRSKSALDEPVQFSAKDSMTYFYKSGRANFYGDSKVNYLNLELTADYITMNVDSSLVHATGRTDSTGTEVGRPVFRQGGDEYEPDSISYNFKSGKAFISNVYTEQGEGILISKESKRDSMGVTYFKDGMYTTCDAKHPHFYLRLTRGKMRPGEDVVFGPAYLVVEDVPLPLAIPYGFFPFTHSYSSGFIMPTYGDETSRGFYLRDGGYYLAISDKIDLKLIGEIYTKGSWALSANSTYKKRYKFNGSFLISYQNSKEGEKNMPDYAVSKSFKVTWTHRQDPKANPSQNFSASVNFATSSYERNNLTSMYNPESLTQSNRTSSISYSRTISSIGLTLAGTFNLAQNMHDSTLAVTLPNLSISLSRLYPFKRKKMAGAERWYEKIALSYSGTLSNSITAKENEIMHKSLIRDWRNGMRHQIPISASFTVANYINITPSFNFTDRMYSNKIMQSWDDQRNAVQRDTLYGFYNVYNYNLSVSANTKLYGMYYPLPWFGGKKISAIRHVFTPSVSFSYAPDFGAPRYGYWDSYTYTDAKGEARTVTYSPYTGSLYGTVSRGKTGSVSMDVSNNVEMKVRTDKDSTGYRKISLIDELGGSLSYNLAAKSRPWSDLSMRIRLKLTKSYTFSLNALFATYAYEKDANGNVRLSDRTEWSHGRFGRFQGMSQNFSYTFNNQTFIKLLEKLSGKSGRSSGRNNDNDDEGDDDDEVDPDMQNVDPERAKSRNSAKGGKSGLDEDGYLKFSLPWSFSVSYGVSMRENTSGKINERRMRYPFKLTHTLNFSGNIRISEGWNVNFSSGYDFNYHKLSMTTASLQRDLHCFSMSCSMVIAPYRSYNFTFACKAGTLADALKWRKQSSYSSNIEWY